MRLCVFVLCVCAVAWRPAASQNQAYLVSCPRALRLDATEKVLVHLFGYNSDQTVYVTVTLKSSMATDGVQYDTQTVQLNSANHYQMDAEVRLYPNRLVAGASHVILLVQGAGILTHQKIPISRTNGYLFVQTDKPLYTPQQSVKVRAFSLNEELRPAHRTVFLKFKDPEHQEVDMVEMTDLNGIPSLQNPFKLPLEPKIGVWTIEASYSQEFNTLAKTDFQVKEYVLPSMSIQLVPDMTYISHDNFEQFSFTITAKYNDGAPVRNADVYCRYGHVKSKSKPTIIPNAVTRHRLQFDGTIHVTENIKRILAREDGREDLDRLLDKYLYVAVLVMENTGGISQEAELASVKFLKSPYSLNLVATPPFIKPGLPYTIQVSVKDHLGMPVSSVPVKMDAGGLPCPAPSSKTSNREGLAIFICNPRSTDQRATLKFVTAASRLPLASQAHLSVPVVAYHSPNARYLYIDSTIGHLNVGNQAYIHVYTAMPSYVPVQSLNYMIMSKGKLVRYGQKAFIGSSDSRQTLNFEVTSAMSPSIRLLVYYIVYAEGTAELVTDSVWINVVDKCVNGLKTTLRSREQMYRPNGTLQLELSASLGGLVALSAVDTALYSLRVHQKDTLNQVLRHIEQSDQGCGGGGGRNNADVFRLAGLTFLTNANASPLDQDEACTAAVRPKRALTEAQKEKKINSIRNPPLREYCRLGMRYSPKGVTCKQYASQVLPHTKYPAHYRSVFTHCCEYLQENLSGRDELHSARSELGPDLDEAPTLVRSFFPESWLWEVQPASIGTISRTLPHSLTTWEFKAVGIFPNGICVADPIRVSVSQEVSIDVPLPYKLVRGEQLELKGSVYNRGEDRFRYCVTLTVGPAVCVLDSEPSAADRRSTRCPTQWRTLAGESVATVSFFLMALKPGEHTLTFTLKTKERGTLDILEKTLRVVPEGVRKEVFSAGILDPQGLYGSQRRSVTLKNNLPPNQVPNTDVEREITIHGDILGEIMAIRDNPDGLRTLVNLPEGSAEAELALVFPLVYVYKYLETAARWNILGGDIKKNAKDLEGRIKDGLRGLTSYRSQSSAAYSMWKDREPSTWLTALIVNALAQTDSVVRVNREALQQTLKWLITTAQNQDGSFKEFSPYSPNQIMSKNATQLDHSVYLTSFVLIGLHKATTMIADPRLHLRSQEDSKNKAADYLIKNAMQVESVYVRAVACYAMTLHDPASPTSTLLYDSLEQLAKEKGRPAVVRYWQERGVTADWVKPDASSALTVATTAYVLLTTIAKNRISYANPILNWLTQDQYHGGAVFSAQDTALTLQAITEYSRVVTLASLNLNIDLKYKRKGKLATNVHLTQRRPVGSPIKVTHDDPIEAYTGFGTGVSHIKLRTVFYQTVATNEDCKFDTSIQTFKADASNDSPRMQACVKYKPTPNEIPVASATVMEIELPSGITPFMEDLKYFRDYGDEPAVSSFRLDGDTLKIQMDSVPDDRFLCIGFRIREAFRVGATSKSMFKVYELQDNKGAQCIKQFSYDVQKLQRLCVAEQCECMTVSCATYRGSAGDVSEEDHIRETCEPHIKYAYKVEVNSQSTEGDFVIYTARVEQVIKIPAEEFAGAEIGTTIDLIKKVTCSSVDLQVNSQYLIMGTNGMVFKVSDPVPRNWYRFPLDSGALVEAWPTEHCSSQPSCGKHRELLGAFSFELLVSGC